MSCSDQQLRALGSFSSHSVGSQLRLIQEVLKTAVSGEGEKKVVLSHSPTSHLFLASGYISFSDAFAPGNIILVQFHIETCGELTLLRENSI